MSAQGNAPIIIKRVKKGGGDAHHGGAWKVAYADFVTAMMAFFMLMWLLNATTEKQRKGIADYFSPTIPVNRVSGGGDGAFGGDSVFTEETLAQTGQGGLPSLAQDASTEAPDGGESDGNEAEHAAETAALEHIEDALTGKSGESMVSELLQRHIVTELTDEGLVIELFDLDEDPLFTPGTALPNDTMDQLVGAGLRPREKPGGDRGASGRPTHRRRPQHQLGAVRRTRAVDPPAARRQGAHAHARRPGNGPCRPPAGRPQSHGRAQQPHRTHPAQDQDLKKTAAS